jgi:hypothetical protein
MNRRNFLKGFSALVAAVPVLRNFEWPTVTTKAVEDFKSKIEPLANFIEIKLDRFNTMRITRLQYRMREEAFKKEGYVCEGNQLIYDPNFYYKGYDKDDYANI